MRQKNLPHFQVVKRHEKSSRIASLVTSYVDRMSAGASCASDSEVLVLARSFDSPVVQELAKASGELQRNRVTIRLIVADAGSTAAQEWVSADGALGFGREIRALRDRRVLDAHEQMILGLDTAWNGDCMRRDPLKQDSFESVSFASVESARVARTCFERLWSQSPCLISISPDQAAAIDDTATGETGDASIAPPVSRHERLAGTQH